MIEFEWEKKGKRAEAAALLRELADSLAGDGQVELEHDGWELRLQVADDVEIAVEVEVDDDETELEIELKWPRKPSGSRGGGGTGTSGD
jgi:amphi-Trp domain-containing protein